ncbi:MAG: Cdc6/Cdc18 family protein [Candidatus Aenigmatarchaeota archaeon]
MSVIKNEEVLSPEYLPANLPHREGQIKLLADNLSLLLKNKKPPNIFIHGKSGVGKTAVSKYVLREFENYSGIKSIYINCWQYNTTFAILSEIGLRINAFISRRGWAKDEIFNRIIQQLENQKINLIVVLDEVDQLIKRDQSILYDLLRIENYTKQKVGLVFISNDKFAFKDVEDRIKSSLNLEEIEFKPYTFLEMKDIVEDRLKNAFVAYENGVSALVASKAAEKGDVRIALQILLKAGRRAKDKLTLEDVKAVLREEMENPKEKASENFLSDKEKLLLSILEKPKNTEQLYEELLKNMKISQSEFNRIVDELIKKNLVEVIGFENKFRILSKRKI